MRTTTALLCATVTITACGGPPSAPVATTLAPAKSGSSQGSHGSFAVAFAGPRGEVVDLSEPAVTVLFNRAMRDPDGPDTAGLPTMRLEPSSGVTVAGSWRWVGTHGLLFLPDQPLPGSTQFHVTIPAGTRSTDGEALTADYAFDFSTPRPRVVTTEPADGATDVRPETHFRVRFNQPMTPTLVAEAAHVRVKAKTGPSRPIAVQGARPTTGKYLDESVVLTPMEKLPKDTTVELVLDAGLHGAGPLATKTATTLGFHTYGPLLLASFVCPRATGPRCEAHRDFTVVLSNPVDPADFKAHLRVPDLKLVPPPKVVQPTRTKPQPTRSLLVAADPDFGRRYRVTLTKGLTDVFGQRLERDLSFDVDTEAPWTPSPDAKPAATPPASQADNTDNEQPETPAHAVDAPVAPTIPHRLRLDYGVQVGVVGHVIEALAKTGIKSHRVPVGDVNVPTYGLFAEKLGEDEAVDWLEHRSPRSEGPKGGWRWTWISPGVPENVRDVRNVDLDLLLGGQRGAALVAIDLPDQQPRSTDLLTLTDLGVSAEVSRFGTLVWVTRLSTGTPVAGASVSLRGVPKDALTTVVTEADGIATFPAGEWAEGRGRSGRAGEGGGNIPYFFVHAGDDWTFAKVERSRASYGTGVDVDVRASSEWAGMLYADRGVYRPGEVVKLAGVFRKVDAAGVTIVPEQEARVLVEDAQGEKVFDARAKLGKFGDLALDVPLSKTTHYGSATVKVELGRKQTQSFTESILLAAYKASEFKVGVDPEQASYVRGDTAGYSLHAEYLFGAPMAGAHFRGSVLRRATPFTPAHSDGYITSDALFVLPQAATVPGAVQLKDEEGSLDDAGHTAISVPLAFADMRGPEEVTFEAEVTDLSQETVAHRASVRLHPAAFYLGIGDLPSRFVAVGANVPVKLVAFEPKGTHVPGVHARVELIARTWTSATLDEAADVPNRTSHLHDEVIASCEATTTADVATCSLHVPRPGYFLVRAQAKDARGNTTGASSSLYCLASKSDAVVSWAPPGPSRKLTLETDKKVYEPGDVAKLLVQNPFKSAEAWVTVERGGILDQRVVLLEGPMPTVDVPVKAEYFPNAFVSVRLVRGRVTDPPARGADVGAPDFRLGVTAIAVDAKTHRLTPVITTDKKQYQPGEEVLADVLVKTHDGKPARGEVTFYAVDEGVLMLTAYETPDPLPAFSANRKLAVFGVESREDLAHLLPMKNRERVMPLGYDYLNPPGGSDKGADGGGGGAGGGPRFDFKTTAFFEAGKVTDTEGHARYQFKLPDNLTTFRLMAIVAGSDDRFGSGEATLVTSKHLMARPVLPRIVRVGDHFDAGVLVSSKDLPAGQVRVTVSAKGVDIASGGPTRAVLVPKGGSVEVRFPFMAPTAGPASFAFEAATTGATDRVLVSRTVDVPVSTETASTYGDTTTPTAIKLGDLAGVRADEGGLTVHLASTALVGLGTSIDRLIDYPYGCTEQLTSRILPLLVLPDLARAVDARLPAHVDDAVDDGVGKLLEHQNGEGGFTYWGEDGESAEPWLSAYAMLAVEGAAQRGLFVPKDARDRGVAYLHRVLNQSVPAAEGEPANDNQEPDDELTKPLDTPDPKEKRAREYAELAFVADTLASVGTPDPATLDRLFESRVERPLFTQALLLHAMAKAHMPVSELDTLAAELVQRTRVGDGEAFADEVATGLGDFLDSPTRTSALVLRALLAVHPDHPLASRLARGLLSRRIGGAWRSTQENVWALMALDDYRKAQEAKTPQLDARVFLGSTRIGEAHFHGGSSTDQPFSVDMRQVLPESGGLLTFDVSGQGRLFYAAELRAASGVLPDKPRDSGFFVQKLTRALKPSELAAAQKVLPQHGVSSAAPGDLVLFDLLLESAEPRDQIVIDDPMPAGVEPIDFALDTSAQVERVSDDMPKDKDRAKKPKARFEYGVAFRTPSDVHREQHDDRVLTFLGHIEPGIYHFRYLARATTPGDFVVPPTRAACMYSPEVWGASAATHFVIGAGTGAALVAKAP